MSAAVRDYGTQRKPARLSLAWMLAVFVRPPAYGLGHARAMRWRTPPYNLVVAAPALSSFQQMRRLLTKAA